MIKYVYLLKYHHNKTTGYIWKYLKYIRIWVVINGAAPFFGGIPPTAREYVPCIEKKIIAGRARIRRRRCRHASSLRSCGLATRTAAAVRGRGLRQFNKYEGGSRSLVGPRSTFPRPAFMQRFAGPAGCRASGARCSWGRRRTGRRPGCPSATRPGREPCQAARCPG